MARGETVRSVRVIVASLSSVRCCGLMWVLLCVVSCRYGWMWMKMVVVGQNAKEHVREEDRGVAVYAS